MEIYHLENDIKIFYVTASSFPTGVMEAHKTLHTKLQATDKRNFFGISHLDETGAIIYKAAAEELYEGEAEAFGLESFVIKKGNYISQFIPNFCDDPQIIGRIFQKLLAYPGIDPKGYCLEVYLSITDVRCMIPLASTEN